MSDFVQILSNNLQRRMRGEHARRRDVGASNAQLALAMDDVSMVGKLSSVRGLKHQSSLTMVRSAVERLRHQKLIPESADAPGKSLVAAWRYLRELPDDCSDKKMYNELVKESRVNPELRPYVDLVTRVWLLAPSESIVESMGSVIEDIYGDHRQLSHENAARELAICWNGPAVNKADGLTTDRLLNLLQGMPALLYYCTIVFPFGRSNRIFRRDPDKNLGADQHGKRLLDKVAIKAIVSRKLHDEKTMRKERPKEAMATKNLVSRVRTCWLPPPQRTVPRRRRCKPG